MSEVDYIWDDEEWEEWRDRPANPDEEEDSSGWGDFDEDPEYEQLELPFDE